MGFLDFIKRKRVIIEHPVFGHITLEAGKKGPYWMHDAYSDDEITVSIETVGDSPPSDEQSAFFSAIIRDPGALFQRCSSLIGARYEQFFRTPVPANWQEAFKLAGVGVPLAGLASNPWDVSFECLTKSSGYLFTCYFVNGQLEQVGVDT